MRLPAASSMRLALALALVFGLAAAVAGAISYALQSWRLEQSLSDDVRTTAESLVAAADGDRQDLTEQINALDATVRDSTLLVVFIDRATGATFGNARIAVPFAGPRELLPGRDVHLTDPRRGTRPARYLAYGAEMPDGWIIVAKSDARITESREIMIQTAGWGLGVAVALSVGLALAVARRNDRRIARIKGVLDAVGAGNHALRIREEGSDDLARLGRQMDATLDQLEAGIAAIRQVSTDVAHDLRAPLTRLRMRLEPKALDPTLPEGLRGDIGGALADLDGISETFDAILRLSRLQSGMVDLNPASVDLGELARQAHELLAPSAEEAGHELILRVPDTPVLVSGDADLLSQALINLVDNALRHCPSPALVEISAGVVDGRACLAVSDNGPGIAEGDRPRVLQRFVRLDGSRSTPGTGLGLSIADAIATLHRASLRLDGNGPGLRACLIFA